MFDHSIWAVNVHCFHAWRNVWCPPPPERVLVPKGKSPAPKWWTMIESTDRNWNPLRMCVVSSSFWPTSPSPNSPFGQAFDDTQEPCSPSPKVRSDPEKRVCVCLPVGRVPEQSSSSLCWTFTCLGSLRLWTHSAPPPLAVQTPPLPAPSPRPTLLPLTDRGD